MTMHTNPRVVTAIALVMSAACSPKPPQHPTAPTTASIQQPPENLFAEKDLHGSPALSTTFSTHATSFSGSTIDTAVVERVIRSHLKEATRDALDDLLHAAGVSISTKPAKDLVESVASLVAEASDGEARSQTLVASLLRVGTTAWVTKLVEENVIPSNCKGDDTILDTVYEGLAASQYLHPLGFPQSDGKFANSDCAELGGKIAMTIDSIARFPTIAKSGSFESLIAKTSILVKPTSACGAAVLQFLPADAQTALVRVRAAYGKAAADMKAAGASSGSGAGSATTSGQDDATAKSAIEGVDIVTLRQLYESVNLVKSFANAVPPANKAAYAQCMDEFSSYAQSFEADLLRFSADVDVGVNVAAVEKLTQTVGAIVADIKSKYAAELSAMQSTLVRLVDGRALRRGDIVTLVHFIDTAIAPKIASIQPPEAATLLTAVLDALPEAIREDATAPAGIRMDIPALASTVVSRFSRQRERGVYFRATIGAGYTFTAGEGSRKADTTTTYHEEIGVGYRWQRGSLLHGPHVITSGILFNTVENGAATNHLFVGAGWSLNLYHLIDVSASAGRLFNLDGKGTDTAMMISLQIPIFDYLGALTEGGDVTQTSTDTGK